VLKESLIITKHYNDRLSERGKILDVILNKDSYEGYNLDEVKNKLIPLLESTLNQKINRLQSNSVGESTSNNIVMKTFQPILEHNGKFYPILMKVKSSDGKTPPTYKDDLGVLYNSIINNNKLITLILTKTTQDSDLIEESIKHLKREYPDNKLPVKVKQNVEYEFKINLDKLFDKYVAPPQPEKTKEEDIPYKIRTDYRINTNFEHEKFGTGKIVGTSSGNRGPANSRGMLDWVDVDFGKEFILKDKDGKIVMKNGKPSLTTIRRIPNVYSTVYFDKQLKDVDRVEENMLLEDKLRNIIKQEVRNILYK